MVVRQNLGEAVVLERSPVASLHALRERGESPIPGLDQLVATFRPGKVRSGDCSLSITLSQPATGASDTTTIDCTVE